MLFYKRARIYYTLSRLVQASNKPFIIQIDLGKSRCFSSFSSVEDFEGWYARLSSSERTVSEVVTSDRRKFFIDIDSPNNDDDIDLFRMYDFVRHVEHRIRCVFAELEIGLPEVLIYDICSDSKISYHVVVPNFLFSAKTCAGLCILVSRGQIWERLADKGVYKTVQNIRVEGSTKFGEERWKKLCIPRHGDSLRLGLVSATDGVREHGLELSILNRSIPSAHTNNSQALYYHFRVRHISGSRIFLNRIRAGMCVQCGRVHSRENAVIDTARSIPAFMCWRYAARY